MKKDILKTAILSTFSENETIAYFSGEHFPISNIYIGETSPVPNYSADERFFSRHHVFEYVLSGEGNLVANNKSLPIKAGDTIIIRSNTNYSITQNELKPLKKIWIMLSATYVTTMLEKFHLTTGVYNINNEFNFKNLASLIKSSDDNSLLFFIAENIHEIITRTSSLNFKLFQSPAMIIKSKLDSLVYEKYQIKNIAEDLGLSLSTLTRTFKQAFNVTPGQYIIDTKINVAKSLLSSSKLPIKNISYLLNFTDEYYFTYIFTKKTGISPSNFRKQSR